MSDPLNERCAYCEERPAMDGSHLCRECTAELAARSGDGQDKGDESDWKEGAD